MPEASVTKSITATVNLNELFPDSKTRKDFEGADDKKSLIIRAVSSRFPTNVGRMAIQPNQDKVLIKWSAPTGSEEAETLNKEGLQLAKRKDLRTAIEKWRKAIMLNPSDPDYQYNIGLAFFESKEYPKAQDRFNEALRLCPIYFKAHFVLGAIFSRMRKFEEAEAHIKKGLMFHPNNSLALINLGAIFSIRRKFDDAIRMFETAISISAKEPRAYLGLAKLYAAQGDIDNANRCFKAVIKLDPSGRMANIARRSLRTEVPSGETEANAEELYAEGYRLFISGDYAGAIHSYNKYLMIRKSDADVWSSLSACQLRSGDSTGAIESLQKAISLNPQKAAYQKQLAIVYDVRNMPEKAAGAAQKAVELGKRDSVTLGVRGKNIYRAGRPEEALGDLQESVRLNPNNLSSHYFLALSLKEKGQRELAKQHFEEVVWSKAETPLKDKARQEIEKLFGTMR